MSYTPTTWETGDTITAEKLNNIEQGIVSGTNVTTVHVNYNEETETYTLDMKAGELWAAILAEQPLCFYYAFESEQYGSAEGEYHIITSLQYSGRYNSEETFYGFQVYFYFGPVDYMDFHTWDANNYPIYNGEK